MKQNLVMGRAERAQRAMMLEVCAYPKPGNVDRCHDYPDTRLEHFLASAIMVRPVFDEAEKTGGRVGFFLQTDDFWRDYASLRAQGVHFAEEPRREAYGTVVVFEDLYGNRWDLLQQGPVPDLD
mgnify:CR=1 FL=1